MSIIRSALLGAVAFGSLSSVAMAATPSDVLANYGDIAQAAFEDSLSTAMGLETAINTLVAEPTEANLKAARRAWLVARNPYQQTEVYRFGNAIVDDWEGKVNAWPLDEGLIDYVDASYGADSEENPFYAANIIANTKVTIAGEDIDATNITPALLSEKLQEAGEVESNVATGYHAVEFLLWGQDLNGTGKGAGSRPATDYDTKNCTGGNCDRRAAYLQAATKLLITDLEDMVAAWQVDGAARKELADKGDAGGIATILTGMGSLSYGELAGERMKLGLMLNDPEEEHDCFSDNTHMSHYNDVKGINNVFFGEYKRVDGTVVKGASLKDLIAKADAAISTELSGKLTASMGTFTALKVRAETTEAYDQMIGEGNTEGNAVVQAAIDSLIDQTTSIQRAVKVLKLEQIAFEGSDSLDSPSAVFE
ncbi:imelysin family protein [Pseudovibrio sp. Tun.PSC04-5.I4]|uniref:imelysin family protein n=1 Tax=Pseudovibrio sp. Tun.PSC04-5.I4 TaxID=1798213 RepID=UPI00088456D9|nr:imelysin family protein [Pseudovibrio sp. Tun.PSC04-5.I4]SDR25110.1 putative iron-regulated protein [Pseudovibrio sp. Tun.PSC04-5.I4]